MSNKNDSRENILAAARRLFHLQGYHATGLNQILKESGAPKGSLYYHFPEGKEQLAIEAVEAMAVMIIDDMNSALSQYKDAIEAVQYQIRIIAERFDQMESLECIPIGLLAAETSLFSEPLRIACKTAFESMEATYCQKLQESGYELETAQRLSIVINSMIEGAITRSLANKNGQPLHVAAECIPHLLRQ